MKTIPELSACLGIHRDTLRKAAIRGAFPNRKAGERTYLIDEESSEFKEWLQSRERKADMKWIDKGSYYAYPVDYSSQTRAAKAAQTIGKRGKIFTETRNTGRLDRSGKPVFEVITRNDVPHD